MNTESTSLLKSINYDSISFKAITFPNKAYIIYNEGDFLFSQQIQKLIQDDLSSKTTVIIEQENNQLTLYKDGPEIRFNLKTNNKEIKGTLEALNSKQDWGIQFDEPSALGKKELVDCLVEIATMLDKQYPNMSLNQ